MVYSEKHKLRPQIMGMQLRMCEKKCQLWVEKCVRIQLNFRHVEQITTLDRTCQARVSRMVGRFSVKFLWNLGFAFTSLRTRTIQWLRELVLFAQITLDHRSSQ